MYSCDMCDKEFDSKQALGGHRSGTHKTSRRYAISRTWKTPKYCQQCSVVIEGRGPKFCSRACQQAHRKDDYLKRVTDSGSVLRPKKFVLELHGKHCSECGLAEWRGHPIPLDLDHIDGNNKNNKIENLRLLCPNCHRLTPTWGNSRFQRENKRFINSPVECFVDIEDVAGSIPA